MFDALTPPLHWCSDGGDQGSDRPRADRSEFEPITVADVAPERVQSVFDVVCSAANRRYAAPFAFDALCKLLASLHIRLSAALFCPSLLSNVCGAVGRPCCLPSMP